MELEEYRGRFHNQVVEIETVLVRIKPNKTQVVMVDVSGQEHTYKLEKEIKETTTKESGLTVETHKTETVTEETLNEFLPSVFTKIVEYLEKHKTIKLNMTYSQSAMEDKTGETIIYRWLYKSDVETIYSPKLYETDERLQELIKRADEYSKNKKGKDVSL